MALVSRLDPWAPPIALMVVIFVLSAQPDLDSGLGTLDLIARKLVHLGEYAVLCLLWWRALRTIGTPGQAAAGAFLATVAYAISDEFHQTFVTGRTGSAVDVLIDSAGAALAALLLARRD